MGYGQVIGLSVLRQCLPFQSLLGLSVLRQCLSFQSLLASLRMTHTNREASLLQGNAVCFIHGLNSVATLGLRIYAGKNAGPIW
jgi:hypothetical protein